MEKNYTAIFGLMILIAISTMSNGQVRKSASGPKPFTVTWGPDNKMKGSPRYVSALGSKSYFYVVTYEGKNNGLARFNSSLEMEEQKTLKIEESDKSHSHMEVRRFLELDKKLFVITSEKSLKEKKLFFYIEEINITEMASQGDKKEIYSVDYSENKRADDADFSFLTPDDERKRLLIIENLYKEKGESPEYKVKVYDQNVNELYAKTFSLPLKQIYKGTFSATARIADNDDLFFTSRVYEEDEDGKAKKKDVEDGEVNFKTHIFYIPKSSSEVRDVTFNLKDKAVRGLHFNINKAGDLAIAGFYSLVNDKGKGLTVDKGIFNCSIDLKTLQVKSENFKEFSDDALTTGLSAKQAEKVEKKLDKGKDVSANYTINEFIPRSDGSSTLVAEQYYFYTVTVSNGKSSYTNYHYVYRNILFAKINTDGKIEWVTVIPKHQHTVNDNGMLSSFYLFDHEDDSYSIFFLDNKKNMFLKPNSTMKAENIGGRSANYFSYLKVDKDGNATNRSEAFQLPEDDEKTRIYPGQVVRLGDAKEFFLYGTDRSKDKYIKVQFNPEK